MIALNGDDLVKEGCQYGISDKSGHNRCDDIELPDRSYLYGKFIYIALEIKVLLRFQLIEY